jgi:ferritin
MEGIENVQQVADLIDKTRRAERRRRGLYVEQM